MDSKLYPPSELLKHVSLVIFLILRCIPGLRAWSTRFLGAPRFEYLDGTEPEPGVAMARAWRSD